MRRRECITLLGGAAAAWPLAARAQDPMRRIGLLNDYTEADPVGQAQLAAFRDELGKLGWTDGHNIRIDYSTGAADSDAIRTYAAQIIANRAVCGRAGSVCDGALLGSRDSVGFITHRSYVISSPVFRSPSQQNFAVAHRSSHSKSKTNAITRGTSASPMSKG